ncbi:mannitol dehydrogenase family protein [Sphaerisporangium sp. NPDC051011]|uniref:mannitol dehydrogenase family protein n=1 Tax=Sphaerisporangium sp. NPDC051011 TaxID=3155792 RepID=UPI0033E3B103
MTESIAPITYDRAQISVGIVHFGVGNFHRSHQAMYLDRLLRNPSTFAAAAQWGICGIGVLPSDARMRDALRSQGHEYTLIERHPDGAAPATCVGSIVDFLYAPDEIDAVLERLADPATRIVSLTITEGGYNISDVTGEFDTANPAIVADAQPGAAPATVFGIIVAGLRLRREREVAPFTIMSCDNIEGNGDVARRSFAAFAGLIDPELASWIESSVSFPNCMVDRITPVTTDADRAWVLERYGVDDAWPVLSEDFVQWVLEDHFPLGRPAFEQVGVQLVGDVRPYELMKLRLLNAGHQALAYSGILSGYEFAHEGASDPVIVGLLRAYMDREATPTLAPVPGVDLDAYKDRLIERFANPYVRDTLARLATDASDRIPKWLVPVIRERRDAGESVPLSASVVAGWVRYAERHATTDDVPFRDRQEAAVLEAVARNADDPVGFLRNPDWFGTLADDADFVADYVAALDAFRRADDPRSEIERLVQG